MPKYFLSVVAMFKNEAHILKEWLDHYLAEGVDHFYLIDNNSTDGYRQILQSYLEKGLISLFVETGDRFNTGDQVAMYNRIIFPLKHESEWLAIVDLDEFVYSRGSTTADYIRALSATCSVNVFALPELCFGSSGHIQQPGSVIQGFQMRRAYNSESVIVKSIIRPHFLLTLYVHRHDINGWFALDGAFRPFCYSEWMTVDENLIRDSKLLLNHYQVQSREWFFNVKLPRSVTNVSPNDWGLPPGSMYFDVNNTNEVFDNTLAVKRQRC